MIFDGIMDAQGYADILRAWLLPFLRSKLPVSHRLMQDNDPKHTSRLVKDFRETEEVKTPPESTDCNPIENMWHELKEYSYREVKPKTKDELVSGIREFWATISVTK